MEFPKYNILSPNVSVTVITHDVSLNTIIGNWTMLVTLGVIFYFLGQSNVIRRLFLPPQEPQRFPMFPPEEPFWNGNRRQ